MAKINFGGVDENVVTREEFTLEKAREVLKDEVIAVIGYGVQGPGQALNLKDNGFNGHLCVHFLRDMDEAKKNDPNYGVANQETIRKYWKKLTGQEITN